MLLGIQSLAKDYKNCHIQVETDNSTALAYINNMGGTKSRLCNSIAKELLLWCKVRKIWLSACFIPGIVNTADILSRKLNHNIEWSLHAEVFDQICRHFGTPDIDLFASRINHKLPRYVAYKPDPHAQAIDAFAHKWDLFSYIFPPFNLA